MKSQCVGPEDIFVILYIVVLCHATINKGAMPCRGTLFLGGEDMKKLGSHLPLKSYLHVLTLILEGRFVIVHDL